MKETKIMFGNNLCYDSKAVEHTKIMEACFHDEILTSIQETECYGPDSSLLTKARPLNEGTIKVLAQDSVAAIFNESSGKTAVLNFASYKKPGGLFLEGSRAQEECLCHESTLFNVLKECTDYYEFNNTALNKGLYLDRALYSPNIKFVRNGVGINCDVITCAAPNKSVGTKYGNFTEEDNRKALVSRINFVLNIAIKNNVETLILGAWGCGVFAQDPIEVANLFKEALENENKKNFFDKIIFAIPVGRNSTNFDAFFKVLADNAYSEDEARKIFLQHIWNLIGYWAAEPCSEQEKLEGLAHSILVALDGGAAELPGYNVVPISNEEDVLFHKIRGEKYYPEESYDIAGCLHGSFYSCKPTV